MPRKSVNKKTPNMPKPKKSVPNSKLRDTAREEYKKGYQKRINTGNPPTTSKPKSIRRMPK